MPCPVSTPPFVYRVMSHDMDKELPRDLAEVADTLRRSGPGVSRSQLEEIKYDALGRASRAQRQRGPGMTLRSKFVTLSLAAALALTGGTAGVLATGPDRDRKSAAKSQYLPGKGCGDKNHTHVGPPGNPDAKPCPPKAGPKK